VQLEEAANWVPQEPVLDKAKLGSPVKEGLSANPCEPVFVTVTTDCVMAFPTRLLPKSKEEPLNEAVVVAAAAGLTLSAVVKLWLSVPETAWTERVAFPVAAAAPAVRLICCRAPMASEKVAGVAVIPLGRPLTVTLTLPVKPFTGEAVTVVDCAAPPAVSDTVLGAIATVKSGEAAGVVDVVPPEEVLLVEPLPPPHPAIAISREIAQIDPNKDRIKDPSKHLSQVILLLTRQK
jgi:hypothetical protein